MAQNILCMSMGMLVSGMWSMGMTEEEIHETLRAAIKATKSNKETTGMVIYKTLRAAIQAVKSNKESTEMAVSRKGAVEMTHDLRMAKGLLCSSTGALVSRLLSSGIEEETIYETVNGAIRGFESAQAAIEMGISRGDAFDMTLKSVEGSDDDNAEYDKEPAS